MRADNVEWATCAVDGCVGVRLPTGEECWAHADGEDLESALRLLGEHGRLDARGVPLTAELSHRLLAAVPRTGEGNRVVRGAQLDQATFLAMAGFDQTLFEGAASFAGTTFEAGARFNETTFERGAVFVAAVFRGLAEFGGAAFHGGAGFERATFHRATWFDSAMFQRGAGFGDVTFHRASSFRRVTFEGTAGFDRTTFRESALFMGATFQRARQFGPVLVRKALVLDEAIFHERVQVQVSAAALCCRRTRFVAGVQLRVRWAQIALGLADLAAPSTLTANRPFLGLEEGRWAQALERLRAPEIRGSRPRLLAVRRADVAGLTVSGVDLRACRFIGAHHLDLLDVEESEFAVTPKGWRWTTRLTIAEEHHWRATQQQASDTGTGTEGDTAPRSPGRYQLASKVGWYGPAQRPPTWLGEPATGLGAWGMTAPSAAQIAALYRALRKGREDNRDEPGAADFYYGEMEMRRHAKRAKLRQERQRGHLGEATGAGVEYLILWIYWLISGYGLRAWRALATLTSLIGLIGVGFSRMGFHHPRPSLPIGWLYALQATVSLEGRAQQLSGQLTIPGELLWVGMRLTGPLLLGLAAMPSG